MKELLEILEKNPGYNTRVLISAIIECNVSKPLDMFNFMQKAKSLASKLRLKKKTHMIINAEDIDYDELKCVYKNLKARNNKHQIVLKNIFMPFDVRHGVRLIAYDHAHYRPLKPINEFTLETNKVITENGEVELSTDTIIVMNEGQVELFLVKVNKKYEYRELKKYLLGAKR